MAFKAEGVIVRRLDNLTIIFRDAESIWVEDSQQTLIFHRWFAPRGSYHGWANGKRTEVRWGDFRRKMMRNRYSDSFSHQPMQMRDCCQLAARCGVLIARTHRKLDLTGRKVIYRK